MFNSESEQSANILTAAETTYRSLFNEDPAALRERISAQNGWVQVFIHPYFDEVNLLPDDHGPNYTNYGYYYGREKALAVAHTAINPLLTIAFVENRVIAKESGYYPESNTVFVETEDFDPSPALLREEVLQELKDGDYDESEVCEAVQTYHPLLALRLDYEDIHTVISRKPPIVIARSLAWHKANTILKEMGVEHVILRGRNLTFSKHIVDPNDYLTLVREGKLSQKWLKGVVPDGCVGDAFLRMEFAGFDVRLSNVTFPKTKWGYWNKDR